MCAPTFPTLKCESYAEVQSRGRIGISSLDKCARGLVTMALMATFLSQHFEQGKTHLTNLLIILTDKSTLTSFLMVGYVLLARLPIRVNLLRHIRLATGFTGIDGASMTNSSSTEALCKIGLSISKSSIRLLGCLGQNERRSMSISSKEPFHPTEEITKMSVTDIRDVFRYAVECNQVGFTKKAFLSQVRPAAKLAIAAIDRAVEASRGATIRLSQSADCGDIDVLTFAAAVRLFAEWRSLRLVPRGYHRFAYSMGLAKRDLILNVKKIEAAAHAWMKFHESEVLMSRTDFTGLASPSMRDVIQHEIDQKMHPLPRLSNKSGASGFLWTKRQLQYQTTVFQNLAQVPTVFPSAKSAVSAAYQLVYEKYHGFLAKRIFQSSFEAAPDANTILKHMRPPSDVCPIDNRGAWIHLERQYAHPIPNGRKVDFPKNPIYHVASHLTKLQSLFAQCAGFDGKARASMNALASVKSLSYMESSRSKQVKEAPKTDILQYLHFMQPFLQGLDNLVSELNINDPTKV